MLENALFETVNNIALELASLQFDKSFRLLEDLPFIANFYLSDYCKTRPVMLNNFGLCIIFKSLFCPTIFKHFPSSSLTFLHRIFT